MCVSPCGKGRDARTQLPGADHCQPLAAARLLVTQPVCKRGLQEPGFLYLLLDVTG